MYQVLQFYLHIQNNCVSINTIVHPTRAASKSRNGAFIPMIPFLLATALSCSDAESLIEKFNKRDVSQEQKIELIEVIKTNSDEGCWDAND